MSRKVSRCPGCAARIEFDRPGALLVVCEHCNLASWRTDVKLERIGKVAELAPIESPIALGAEGRLGGAAFRVAGVVELDHGRGPWHEWAIRFEDGAWAWLAEAQGQYLVTRAADVELASVPAYGRAAPGSELDLGAHGRFVVAERGRGTVTTFRGELPERIEPGATRNYADLAGPAGGFGTLDYGPKETCEAVFLGRRHEFAELGLDGAHAQARVERKVLAKGLACPKCQGSIELADPSGVERLGCPYCDALLSPDSEGARVVGVNRTVKATPRIPLGARGTLRGGEYEVIAFLVRSVRSEGVRYPWDEYLLRRADGAYRWLVCSTGHWSFVEPVNLADVKRSNGLARLGADAFKHFSSGEAKVDLVLGEVYWQVEVGESVKVADYVAPPRMLSFETTQEERIASLGHYVEPRELERAFALAKPLGAPQGVGAIQPNPHPTAVKQLARAWAALAALLVVLLLYFAATHDHRVVYEQAFPLTPSALENGLVGDEFELTANRANARLELVAVGLPEGRFRCEGALVEVASQRAHAFSLAPREASPAELGDSRGDCSFTWGSLPAGRYRVRLEPHAAEAHSDRTVDVRVVSQNLHLAWPFLLMALLALPPLVWMLVAAGFESARWTQSDHA
ncbi:MAG: DUF4178 domain-containing protein [Planctomycetes bacterium]|nr:DUF4178 domain-containing protein [Planctomycetota bacterium]